MRHKIFLLLTGLAFFSLAAIFVFMPRSTFSTLEKRELATFPEFTWERLFDGSFTADVSTWFSDSEPYRDTFMEAHMNFKDMLAMHRGGEDAVAFHADAAGGADVVPGLDGEDAASMPDVALDDGTARIASKGIIVAGSGPDVRAMMVYGGSGSGKSSYAATANHLKKTFGSRVNVYCMIIPTSIEYYCPNKVKDRTRSQLATIKNIHSQLDPGVREVDVHTTLGIHAEEPIFLRTDHHWAPLGAYYAARKLAQVAGVHVPDLKEFDRKVVHGFVGTMYGYSKDINVKKAPEDFVYYTPRQAGYSTTYIIYNVDKDFRVTGKSAPHQGTYFKTFKDGSGAAYCTFMGTDMATVKVDTHVQNGRRVLIIKDSFGNAIPGYLFGSFEQVHVIDFRYFIGNLQAYVRDNKITDVVMAFNIFNAYSGSAAAKIEQMLRGVSASAPAKEAPEATHDPQPAKKEPAPQPASPTETPVEISAPQEQSQEEI